MIAALRIALTALFSLAASAALATPIDWRFSERDLDVDGASLLRFEFAILDLPDGDLLRVSCQSNGDAHFQVLLKTSDAQKSPLTLRFLERGKVSFVQAGPLVYRPLKGIHKHVPSGLLPRMVAADALRVSIDMGLNWHFLTLDSTRSVLPALSCYKQT